MIVLGVSTAAGVYVKYNILFKPPPSSVWPHHNHLSSPIVHPFLSHGHGTAQRGFIKCVETANKTECAIRSEIRHTTALSVTRHLRFCLYFFPMESKTDSSNQTLKFIARSTLYGV